MKDLGKEAVTWLEIDESAAGQRIDNFLMRQLKGVPKSHIYRILRSGEVRVNSGRIDATCRLALGDKVRIPPIRVAAKPSETASPQPVVPQLDKVVLYEDDALLVINKPSGLAVHGGSGISRGVIEQLRLERPELKFLELAHRLDRETSGVLILAKKRSALTKLHDMLRDGEVEKRYLALVKGVWRDQKRAVKLKLHKYLTEAGERRVSVSEDGKASHTIFYLRQSFADYSLLECELKTGRTHQIRVHLAHLGYPIAGDDKYGDFPLNKQIAKQGLKRMFLHAFSVSFLHPLTGEKLQLEAPLPKELDAFVRGLEKA
ncbi:MAG: RNA pseudouridine synthase [Betaproteobacteria bacterium RBG_19FT_COMBO_58_11]|nr:MAG: RNA pseudouridine synthase [Betaproteobacteria bacterium RBG_19FT_COMBO_58_11]